MNLPNKLTVLRVILIPVFIFFLLAGFIPYNDYIALGVFAVASITDFFDGVIARKKNLVTNFGKFMDPLADKMLVVSALVCLLVIDNGERMCTNQVVAALAVLVIIVREFIIQGVRLVASDAGIVIAASYWGKFKTFFTMIAICMMIVVKDLPFLEMATIVIFWVSVTLTVVSLVDYLVKNIDVFKDAGTGKKVRTPREKGKKDAKKEKQPEVATPEANVIAAAPETETVHKPKFDTETGLPLE